MTPVIYLLSARFFLVCHTAAGYIVLIIKKQGQRDLKPEIGVNEYMKDFSFVRESKRRRRKKGTKCRRHW